MVGKPIDENGAEIQECSIVPTGMLMIRRKVFEQLYAKHKFIFNQGFMKLPESDIEERQVLSFFTGEDVHFCKLWRAMEGKLFVKTSVRVGHVGEKVWRI